MRDWAAALLLVGMLALAIWAAWLVSPQDGARRSVAGTIIDLWRDWPPNSRSGGLVRLPYAELEVRLPDGRVRHLTGGIRLLDQCRKGGAIRLETRTTNGGRPEAELAANPCDPPAR